MVLQTGKTALQILAKRYTWGDESKLTEGIDKGRLVVAVKAGDVADVQRLVECQGVDVNATTPVRHDVL